ncbi:MAG: phenylacetate--CoA ligase family protein [Chitinispirillaceae bacterium]
MAVSTVAAIRRKLADPLIGMVTGSPKSRYWREVEKTQYLSPEELYRLQWKRVNEMVQFIYENNSFYRSRMVKSGMNPQDIKTPDEFSRLPILTKNDIRDNIEKIISDGYKSTDLKHFKTGGSTGKSLDIMITEECSEMRNAVARRHDQWAGWRFGEPVGAVWGNPHIPRTLKEKARHFLLQPTIYLDTMELTGESVKKFAAEWRKSRPTLLFGHAHSLYLLAQMAETLGIDDIRPRGVISTSMMLMPHERAQIERSFDAEVYDRYGCEEVSLIASECERHEGMHLNIEHLYVEFLREDGSAAKPGESGRVIVTDLINRAMPFVRYQVEDMGVPIDRFCSCGRGLPLMQNVTGRLADFLIRHDGSRVAGISLIENTLTKFAGIDQMQIVQESLDSLVLNVVPGKGYNRDTQTLLIGYFNDLFNEKATVELRLIDEIQPEPSGKYRFSICKIAKSGEKEQLWNM